MWTPPIFGVDYRGNSSVTVIRSPKPEALGTAVGAVGPVSYAAA